MKKVNTPSGKKKFTIGALFRNNRFVAVFAVVVAVIVWFAVSVSFNPIVERTIVNVPIQIPLSTSTAHSDLKAYEGSDTTVSVQVSGKKYIVDQLTADDVTVTASLNGVVGVGTYTLELSASANAGMSDFDVLSVSPSSVSVTLDNEAVKTFDVEVRCNGASADGDYGANSILVVEPEVADESYSTLTVVGAASTVQQIDHVIATADVNETLTESKQVTARVMMYNIYNELLYDAADPDNTTLTLTEMQFTEVPVIARVNMIRDVPLRVNYRNAPQTLPGITISEINQTTSALNPVSQVRIKGALETISSINEIALDGYFDFMSLDPSNPDGWYRDMSLPVLSGVSYINYASVNDAAFRVSVDSTDLSVKSYDLSEANITVANTTYSISVESSLLGIQVIGPPQSLRNLPVEDITATLDATGLSPGTYTLRPTFQIASSRCWVAGNYEVTIQIS